MELLLESKDKCLHFAVGDFNTRLHARGKREERAIGPFIWGRGKQFVQKMTPIDKEQRGVLVAALKASDHIHMNAFFEKTDEKKATRSDWQATGPHMYQPDTQK